MHVKRERGSLVCNTILAGGKTFLIDSCQQFYLKTLNLFLFTIALYGKKIVCFCFILSEFLAHVNEIILKGKRTTELQIDIIKLLSTVSKDVSTPFCKGEIKGFHQLKFYSVFSYSTSMRDLLLKTLQIRKIYGNCCGTTVGSEQQHNQDLRDIYKGRRILEFITFYQNALHLTRVHCATFYQNALRQGQLQ